MARHGARQKQLHQQQRQQAEKEQVKRQQREENSASSSSIPFTTSMRQTASPAVTLSQSCCMFCLQPQSKLLSQGTVLQAQPCKHFGCRERWDAWLKSAPARLECSVCRKRFRMKRHKVLLPRPDEGTYLLSVLQRVAVSHPHRRPRRRNSELDLLVEDTRRRDEDDEIAKNQRRATVEENRNE